MDAPRPRRRSSWDDEEGFGRRMLNTLTGRLVARDRSDRASRSDSRSGSRSGSRTGSSKQASNTAPAIVLTFVFIAWLAGAGAAYYLNRPAHPAVNADPTPIPSVTTGTPASGTTTPAATGTPGK